MDKNGCLQAANLRFHFLDDSKALIYKVFHEHNHELSQASPQEQCDLENSYSDAQRSLQSLCHSIHTPDHLSFLGPHLRSYRVDVAVLACQPFERVPARTCTCSRVSKSQKKFIARSCAACWKEWLNLQIQTCQRRSPLPWSSRGHLQDSASQCLISCMQN